MVLAIVMLYVAIGMLPLVIGTLFEDFWETALDGIQYEDPAKYEAAVEAFREPVNFPWIVLTWPSVLWLLLKLVALRRHAAALVADAEEREELVKEIPGAVLALEAGHRVQGCVGCRTHRNVCTTLAVFYSHNIPETAGRAMVLDRRTGEMQGAFRVERQGQRFVFFERQKEAHSERFVRLQLTHQRHGCSYEEALERALYETLTAPKEDLQ